MKITGAAEDVETGARHCTLLVGVGCGVGVWHVRWCGCWESMVALPHIHSPHVMEHPLGTQAQRDENKRSNKTLLHIQSSSTQWPNVETTQGSITCEQGKVASPYSGQCGSVIKE